MGGKESRPLCPKCKKPREEWRELPSVEKDFEEGSKTSNKTTDVKERKADTLCADCLVTQLERKDPVRGQNELEQDLKGALEVAKGICAMDRRKEAEKCQSSEVNKEVFHEEAGSNPGDKLRRESIPFPADETDASNQQALCETFKRLMRQDRFVAADVLNQVRELIIAKLSKTAAGETSEASGTVGTTDLKPIVQRLSYILGTETKRQHLLTIALNDTWSCMLNVEILERCSKLKFLELLLHFLDELRKNEADGTWVEVQRECLRCVLGEMGLDFTVASPLLSLTGQGHWSGQQALNLFNILTKCGGEHTDHRKTVEFLELLQKHNLPSTWTNPQGLSVMDMINQTSELKALHQRLKKQLVSGEEDLLKCLETNNVPLDKTSNARVLVNKMYKQVKDDNITNPWVWLDLSIMAILLLVISSKTLEYSGPVGIWVITGIFCLFMVYVISTRDDWSQREDNAEQIKVLRLLTNLYRAFSSFKGGYPTCHQMLTLCELITSPEIQRPWRYVTVVQDHSCIAFMLTALQAMHGKVVGVLMDSPSHRPVEWEELYCNLDIKYCTDTMSTQISPKDKMVLFGDLEGFVNNFLQRQPWVEKGEEKGVVFMPQSFVLGGHLPEDTIKFGHLGKEDTHIQSTLMTLVKAASTSMKHQTKMVSILLFALNTLSDPNSGRSMKYTSNNKLAAICKQFSTQTISKKDFNLVRLLEIVLRCIHCHQQVVEKERETHFDHSLEMICFESLMASAATTCQMDLFQHSLKVLSTLVRLKLWDGVEVLDLFYLLVRQLGKTGNFREKILNAIISQKHLKQQMINSSPVTLSSTLRILQLMEVNLVPSGFKDAKGLSLAELLQSSDDGPCLFTQLQDSLQQEREKSLDDILSELQKASDFEGIDTVCETIKYIVDHVAKEIQNPRARDTPGAGESKNPDQLKLILLYLCQSVKSQTQITPRLTQMVSWCLLVLSESGRLLQLGTGEGKSCVVAMFAAYRARWSGNKVDVLSSSPVLAKRDSDEWCPFYNDLNISVDCNTEKKNDESRKSCYNAQVVYGTVESFAADCLRQEFEKKDVRPERQFQCIIVDEVDSLLLDHGVQTTYLSSDMPAMEHLNIILATIWSMIKQFKFIPNSEPPTVQGPPLCFYKVLYENTDLSDDLLKGLLEKGEKDAILPPGFCASPDAMLDKCENLTEDSLIAFFSMASNVLGSTEMSGNLSYYTRDSNGQLKLCKGSNENMLSFLLCDKGQCSALYDVHMLCQDVEQAVRSNLHFSNVDKSHKKVPQEILFIQNTLKKISMKLLNKKSTDPNATANTIDTRTHIPGFLKNLVDQKLGMWVQNAFQALQMQEKERYIVCPDGICPVDSEHTGVVERNKKWGDGLQQFLEMKHRIKLNSMTVITNFLSNVSFFKKYQGKIYGTTGTIGNKYEITSLTELYNGLSTVKIPSFLNSKLFEEAGEMLGDEHQWTEKICTAVLQQTRRTRYRDGRAALVICETIKQAQNIFRALDKRQQQQTNEIRNLKIYTDDRKDNTNVTGQELRPGDVIVATNLAGRGTDIVVSKEVLTAGGLFVVLTFLPANDRVEQQAFGRTARQGRPGSAQLLACSTHLPSRVYDLLRTSESPGPLLLQEARDARDHVSAKRVKQVLKNDIPRILQREELFEEYCGILEEDVYKKNTEKGNRKVLVAILNEYWGLWYLRRSDELRENNLEQLKGELRTDMKNKLTKNSQCSSMYHYIKFGNKLMFEKKYEESIKLYTKAIELDKEWAAIAYYYCAYAQYKTYCQRGITQDFISNLEKACESVDLYISQYQTILCLLCGKENDESQPDRSMGLELHGAVMQTASREEEAEEKTEEEQRQENSSLHEQITAKIHLWVFFRQNIEAVIKENSKTMKKCTVFSLMKSPSTVEQREMFRLHQMGLEMVFGTSDMLRFCWQGMVVISLGVVELFGSLLLGDMGLALVSSLGAGENSLGILGTQGARDIMVGIRAMKTGDVNWNILMRDKAASFINQFLVLGLFQNQVRKVFKLPDAEQVGMLQMLTNAKTILVSKMNNLSVSPRRNLDHVSKLICEYGLKMEDQVNLKEICDSVSESILAKSLEIMAKRIESDPLISLINNLVRHYEPIEDNTVTSCYSVLPKYQTDLEKIFMVLVKRAAESQFTGKKRPKTLVELTESVGRRVVAQLQEGKKEEIGITGIMKQEYEAEFQRSAPQALLDTADEYIKVLCELLEKYSKELGARKGRSAPSSEQLGFFRKKLVKPAASELSQALWEMLLQFLGHQQADLFSSRLRRDLGLTSQSFSKADGRKRAGLKTGVGNIHKKYIQRQRTLRVINQLKDFTE